MPILYKCDFCDTQPVAHNPDNPGKTIVADTKDLNSVVICESCVRLAFKIVNVRGN